MPKPLLLALAAFGLALLALAGGGVTDALPAKPARADCNTC